MKEEAFPPVSEGLALTLGLYTLASLTKYAQELALALDGDPHYLRSLAMAWLLDTMNEELDFSAPMSEVMKAFEERFEKTAQKLGVEVEHALGSYLGRCLAASNAAATSLLLAKENKEEDDE